MRCALFACLLAACYHPSRLECAVSCASGASCPSGLTCGVDQLCHSGARQCTEIDASVAGDDAPGDAAAGDAPSDAPNLAFCTPAQPNVVACYEFDGTTEDSTPNHLNAATAAIGFQPGRLGQALALDQSSSVRIVETALLDLEQFTVEAWLDPLASTNDSNVTVVNNVLQYGLFLDTADQPYCAYSRPELTVTVADTALQRDQWTHVACTYDGTNLTLYVNGTIAKQRSDDGAVSTSGTSGTGIGSDAINNGAAQHYVGLIDGLRIFSVARPQADICGDAGRTSCP